MLDIEYNPYGATCYGLAPGGMSGWIADFSNTVHARTGRYPTIYSTRDWWNRCTGANPGFARNNPLFVANYATSPGTMPAGWGFQTIWQYSDRGVFPGDQDVFNGSLAQLRTFASAADHSPPPPPTPIGSYYSHLGGATSFLGVSVGGEYSVPGGTAQNFQNGRIYYSPLTGAHAVHGAILDRYLVAGGPLGRLGLPTTDELTTPDGLGRFNHFIGSGGSSIYWTPATGAHEVQGVIRAHWAARGWERGPLGYPTTDETATPDGVGRFNHFTGTAGSSIYWTPARGAHDVRGAIRQRWAGTGWERGPLGYPATDQYVVAGGRQSDFVHGSLRWDSTTRDVRMISQPAP
jgi:uncharacterized protein with LGFP repeats